MASSVAKILLRSLSQDLTPKEALSGVFGSISLATWIFLLVRPLLWRDNMLLVTMLTPLHRYPNSFSTTRPGAQMVYRLPSSPYGSSAMPPTLPVRATPLLPSPTHCLSDHGQLLPSADPLISCPKILEVPSFLSFMSRALIPV